MCVKEELLKLKDYCSILAREHRGSLWLSSELYILWSSTTLPHSCLQRQWIYWNPGDLLIGSRPLYRSQVTPQMGDTLKEDPAEPSVFPVASLFNPKQTCWVARCIFLWILPASEFQNESLFDSITVPPCSLPALPQFTSPWEKSILHLFFFIILNYFIR